MNFDIVDDFLPPRDSVAEGVREFPPNNPFEKTIEGWQLYCFDLEKCTGCCINLEFTIKGDSPEINLKKLWKKF